MTNQQKQPISEVMKDLNKTYGANTIVDMGKSGEYCVDAISTNCYSLDYILACGGLPRGRLIELFGAESSGKSTLAMYLIAQVQKQGGKALFLDIECSFDSDWAKKIGVDIQKLIVSQPKTAEEALDILDQMVIRTDIDIVVLDSVAALIPQAELDGGMTQNTIALQARIMSKFLRIICGNVSRSKAIVILINQMREKVGIYFGNKDTTPGGRALKFYSSVRLEVKKGAKIKDKVSGDVIGNVLSICSVKNKVGLPWRKCEIELLFTSGLDIIGDILNVATTKGIITKTGLTYYLGKEKLGVNKDATKKYLAEHPEVVDKIKKELLKK